MATSKTQQPPLPYEDEVLRRMLQARPKTHEEMVGQTKSKKAKPATKKQTTKP
jgi:hypothetical protein